MRALKLALAVLVVVAVLAPPAAAHSRVKVKVIASGLDAPRHLAFGDRGDLYVAEAGRGAGVASPDPSQCFVGGGGAAGMGAPGAITTGGRRGPQRRVLTRPPAVPHRPRHTNPH